MHATLKSKFQVYIIVEALMSRDFILRLCS